MITNLKRNLKVFLLFSKFSMKSTFQARLGVFFFFLGKLLRFLMFFLFVYFLVAKTKLLQGYNVNQVLFFYLTFNIIDTATQLLFREVYRFRPLVISGELDNVLIKPFHPFMRVLIGGIDFLDLLVLPFYFSLTFYFASKLDSTTITHVILYFGLIFNALTIATAFHIAVLALGILTTEVDHAIMIYRDITSVGRFPLEIYQEPIRSIFTFVLPVGIMMSYPSKAFLGLLSPLNIFYSFFISGILLFSTLKLWDFAIKKYQSWGG